MQQPEITKENGGFWQEMRGDELFSYMKLIRMAENWVVGVEIEVVRYWGFWLNYTLIWF